MFLKYLWVILISCVPIIEVKGSIPYGVGMGLNPWACLAMAQIGSVLTTFVLLLLVNPVLKWMKTTALFQKLAHKVEAIGHKKSAKLKDKLAKTDSEKKKKWAMIIGVFIWVAIPLPGTGVWTGALIACVLGIKFKYAFPAVILGNFVASAVMVSLSKVFFTGVEFFA